MIPRLVGFSLLLASISAGCSTDVVGRDHASPETPPNSMSSQSSGQRFDPAVDSPPSLPGIVATNETWSVDPKLLEQLQPPVSIAGYIVRLPQGFERFVPKTENTFVWRKPNQVDGHSDMITFYFAAWSGKSGDITKMEQFLLDFEKEARTNFVISRGRINGLFGWRQTNVSLDEPKVYTLRYSSLSSNSNIVRELHSTEPPGSKTYRLMDASLLSVEMDPIFWTATGGVD